MRHAQTDSVRLPRADAEAPQGLELRHLRYFAAVADAGTFTRAAEQMFIAQPTLSQQIRRLEQIVGTPLLQRLRDGVRLTAAGTVLLDAARDVLSLVDHGVSQTRQTAGLGRQRLRVAMPPTFPETLTFNTASALQSAAAAADVEVVWGVETPLDAEFSPVRQRHADAGLGWLTASPDALPAALDAMSLGEFEPDLWIPASHPAARRGASVWTSWPAWTSSTGRAAPSRAPTMPGPASCAPRTRASSSPPRRCGTRWRWCSPSPQPLTGPPRC